MSLLVWWYIMRNRAYNITIPDDVDAIGLDWFLLKRGWINVMWSRRNSPLISPFLPADPGHLTVLCFKVDEAGRDKILAILSPAVISFVPFSGRTVVFELLSCYSFNHGYVYCR